MLPFRAIFAILFVLHTALVNASPIDERYGKFMAEQKRISNLDAPVANKLVLVSAAYAAVTSELHLPDDAKEQDNGDLELLYRAADVASFYTSDRRYALDMLTFATVLLERNLLTARERKDTYLALIAARAYAPAKRWRERSQLTGIHDEDYELQASVEGRRIVELKLSRRGLEPAAFDVPTGPFLLVVAHPLCHFSQYAQEFIERSPALLNALRGRMKWVSVQQREPDMQAFRNWNSVNPDSHISQMFDVSTWPVDNEWDTPIFYFFNGGRVVTKIVGWPKEGRADELIAALRSAGFKGIDGVR